MKHDVILIQIRDDEFGEGGGGEASKFTGRAKEWKKICDCDFTHEEYVPQPAKT